MSFNPSPFTRYQVYFRIGAEGRRPEAPLRAGGTYDNFAGLASVTAAGPFGLILDGEAVASSRNRRQAADIFL